MSKTLRTIALAMLAVALFAGSAFAAAVEPTTPPVGTITWTGNADGSTWDNPGNWNTTGVQFYVPGAEVTSLTDKTFVNETASEVVVFDKSANVNIMADTYPIQALVVEPGVNVTIRVAAACELKFAGAADMSIFVKKGGNLTIEGPGVLELNMNAAAVSTGPNGVVTTAVGQDFSFVTVEGSSSKRTALTIDVEVKQDRVDEPLADVVDKNVFFRLSDYSDLTFSRPVNNSIGNAWKVPTGDAALFFGTDVAVTYPTIVSVSGIPTHAMLCVNHASQIQAKDGTAPNDQFPFAIVPMQGTLRVASSISVTGGPSSFQACLSAHPSFPYDAPVFDVVDGATFKLTTGFVDDKVLNLWNNTLGINDEDFSISIDSVNGAVGQSQPKFAKAGKGTLHLVGGPTDWAAFPTTLTDAVSGAAALDDEVHEIDVRAGTLTFEKGGRPAWEPSSDGTMKLTGGTENTTENKKITVAAGAVFYAMNTEAIRPNNGFDPTKALTGIVAAAQAPNWALQDIRFENSGTVRIGQYGAMANLLDAAVKGERYPDEEAETDSVYLLPRASVHMVGDEARLEVFGDQAFKRVWGGEWPGYTYGAKILVSGDSTGASASGHPALILTEMDQYEREDQENGDGHRFFGDVYGNGAVAFAKAYTLWNGDTAAPAWGQDTEEDITTQYFPFLGLKTNEAGIITATRNDWEKDTIVYGRSRLVIDQDSILPKPSGKSFSEKGAMYLRSDRPSSLDGDVGTLRARKTTVKGSYPDTVYIDHLKVDSVIAANSRAWIDVSAADYRGPAPFKQGDPYVPLSQEDQTVRSYGLRLLAVKDVTYDVNKALVTAAGGDFRNVFSFLKTGDSTLLLLEKGRGASKATTREPKAGDGGITIQRGRVWVRGEEALAEGEELGLSQNSVSVMPSKQTFVPVADWVTKLTHTEDEIAVADQWTALHVGNGLDIENDLFYEDKSTPGYHGLFVTELRDTNRNYVEGVRAAVNVATKVRGDGMDFQGCILQAPIFEASGVGYIIFESTENIQDKVLRGYLGTKEADTAGGLTVYTDRRLNTGPIGYVLGETAQGILDVAILGEADKATVDEMQQVSFSVPLESNVDIEHQMVKVEALTGSLGQLDHQLTSNGGGKYTIKITGNINANRLGYYFKELVQVSVYVDENGPQDPVDALNGQRVYPITLLNPNRPDDPQPPTPPTPTIPESQSAVSAPSSSTVAHDATEPVTFTLSDASYNAATGELTILDENGVAKTLTAPKVYVNGTAIDPVAGVDFFTDNGDGTVTVTVPASALSTGTNTITVGDDTLRTKGVTVTKEAAPGPGPEPTPSSSGGGGCDAGFGGLALAAAALVVLRKRG